jgi:hypothetical protein
MMSDWGEQLHETPGYSEVQLQSFETWLPSLAQLLRKQVKEIITARH